MHKSSMLRMEWFIDSYVSNISTGKILDVGSYNVNGTYKDLFDKSKYSYEGLDMEKGPNVDIVPESAYQWNEIKDDSYDVVISGQALEHIEFFWITVAEIIRVTKEGGLICIIAPNGFDEHRYPVDCWRFFTDGMIALSRFYSLEIIHVHTNAAPSEVDKEWYSEDCADSMLVARKPYSGKAQIIDLKDYKCIPGDHKELDQGMISYKEFKDKFRSNNHEERGEEWSSDQSGKQKKEKKYSGVIDYAKKAKSRLKSTLKKIVKP